MTMPITDLHVMTENPADLDGIVQNWGGVVCQLSENTYARNLDGSYTVRCYGDYKFITFAIQQQGYGTVIAAKRVDAPEADEYAEYWAEVAANDHEDEAPPIEPDPGWPGGDPDWNEFGFGLEDEP